MAAALLIAASVFGAACGLSKSADPEVAASAPDVDSGPVQPSLFTVTADQLAHLRIVPARRSNRSVSVHTTGTVDFDADQTTQVITQVSGPISRILVDTGTVVKTGDPLLYVASPDVANAISTYRKARSRQNLTRRVFDRTQDLLNRGAAARKDLETAQADYDDATTDVQNSLLALRIYGITKDEIEEAEGQGVAIRPELAVRAPIDGTVVQKMVLPGQLIQAGATACFQVSKLSTVWVQGHIFDHDLPAVRVGDPVEETNPSFSQRFRGVVSYIGAMVDPATRTTPVRIVTRNPGGLLKKDMFVDAVIHTRTERNILTVPVSAVLHNAQNEPFVYVEAEPGKFAQMQITVGAQQDDSVEVTSGIQEGDKVVSEGSLFLQFANSYQ